jgi:hypothetical protein
MPLSNLIRDTTLVFAARACGLCSRFRAGGVFMPQKRGQLISRGPRTWLGREPETGTWRERTKV